MMVHVLTHKALKLNEVVSADSVHQDQMIQDVRFDFEYTLSAAMLHILAGTRI